MTDPDKVYDLVLIGNYTKDTIVSASGKRVVDGGGFNYGAHVAVMMGLKTAAVTRLAREDAHVVRNLEKTGVDMFPYYSAQSTLLCLEYPTDNVDHRILTVSGKADPFSQEHIENLKARTFLINASFRGEIPLEVLKALNRKKVPVAVDVQGFVRVVDRNGRLQYRDWPERGKFLPFITILKADMVEAEMLTGQKEIHRAAESLSREGPEEIVLTHRKGVTVFAGRNFFESEFRPEKLVGRSGRGDTCIAAYAAKRLDSNPAVAAKWAAAVTSLKMEAEGPIRRSLSDVHAWIRENDC
jgi:sugar/nucleoside kinase (ribokinase family)